MAFINKNDFSILSFINDIMKEDYFECDDLIAPAISLLNKKGYKTMFCCSGHAFPEYLEKISKRYPTPEEMENIMYLINIESSKKLKDIYPDLNTKEYPYFLILNKKAHSLFYVKFAYEYKFPELPEGASLDNNGTTIHWNYTRTKNDNYDDLTTIFQINKIFYEWVEKLPSII